MASSIIVYESKNGSTKQYAQWLSEETGIPAVHVSKAKRLAQYDRIILGSCVRMYAPTLGPWIRKHWAELKDKRPVLFTVAGAPADSPKRREWLETSLGPDILASLPHVALNGRMDINTLRWPDRALMKLGIKMAARKNPAEAEAMGKAYDKVDRASLAPLVALVGK